MGGWLKSWKGALVLFLALVVLAINVRERSRRERPSPEVERMLTGQAAWLEVERDAGAFARDLGRGEVSLLGEAHNLYLVELSSGSRYFVVKSTTQKSAIAAWVSRGGRLFALGQAINPTKSASGRAAQAFLGLLFSGPVVLMLLIGILFAVLGARMGLLGAGGKFATVSRPSLRFRDVIGAREAKRELLDLQGALENREAYLRIGAQPPRGVLLSGPPGTGKTLLAKALAGESGASFIAVDGSAFTDKFVGMGVQRVRSLFKTARENAPCVVFIDEIDGVGRRTSKDDAVAQENNRIINALLTELDGFNANDRVIVLAATNHPDNVDPALLREGRFDRKCTLSLPPLADRAELFSLYARDLPTDADVDFDLLARRTSGASPASIASVVSGAARLAARDASASIAARHFLDAISQQQLGTPSPELEMNERERELTAYHEAGHAVVAHALGLGTVEKVTILPHSRALGLTVLSPMEDRHLRTQGEIEAEIQMLLGGRSAELVAFGFASTGAVSDLERASSLAYRMVAELGFSAKRGPFSLAGLAAHVPDAAMLAIGEARELLTAQERATLDLLGRERDVLDAIARALLDHETLEGEQLEALLAPIDRGSSTPATRREADEQELLRRAA